MLDAGDGKLGKEDVLRALYQLPRDVGGTSQSGLPEGDIKNMVQAERDERALNEAVQPGARVAGSQNKAAQRVDTGLDDRPDIIHDDTDHQINRRGNNRHEARAAEEGKHLRQLDFVKPVV